MPSMILEPLSHEYLSAPVGNYLEAPKIPEAGTLALNELTTPDEIKKRARVLAFNPDTGMALIDKKFPHATEEAMWMHADEMPVATLAEMIALDPTKQATVKHFKTMADCAKATEDEGGFPTISWSNDPFTLHRPSIQGEKRLHFHLTNRGERVIQDLDKITMPIGDLNFVDKRRIAEEYSFVASQSIKDLINSNPGSNLDLTDIHPCFVSLRIGDWQDLGTTETVKKIEELIAIANDNYDRIVEVFGGETDEGEIIIADNIDFVETIRKTTNLAPESLGVRLLASYLESCRRLQQPDGNRLSRINNKHLATVATTSKGFAYSGNFSKIDGVLYFNLRPCKFSDLGGAGCAIIDGMPVRVRKGDTPMSKDETNKRKLFVKKTLEIALSQ